MPPQEYLSWRAKEVEARKSRRIAELGDASKLKKKDLEKIEQSLPADLFSALHADTGDLKKAGWSRPPGSVWIYYARQRDAFAVIPRAAKKEDLQEKATIARFAVASQVPPRLTDAVNFAERIHIALVSRSDGSTVFTGCDESNRPLTGHKHAFILSESNLGLGKGRRGEITHAVIHAPMGFELQDRQALDGLSRVWGHGGHDIQLILLGVGGLRTLPDWTKAEGNRQCWQNPIDGFPEHLLYRHGIPRLRRQDCQSSMTMACRSAAQNMSCEGC